MGWLSRKVGSADLTIGVEKVVGKGRHRTTRAGIVYTPRETSKAEKLIRDAWVRKNGRARCGFDGEVRMRVTVWRCLAKSNPKYWAGKADLGKPDWDNAGKLVSDALNGIAYADDSQITLSTVRKMPRLPFAAGSHIRIQIDYYEEKYSKEPK